MSAYEAAEAGHRGEALGAASGGSAWFTERPAPAPNALTGPNALHAPNALDDQSGLDRDVFGDPAYDGPGELFLDSVFAEVEGDRLGAPGSAPHPADGSAPLRLVVVSAGLGQPSTARILADRLADATRSRLAGLAAGHGVAVEVLELRDLALDIAGAMVAGFPGAKLRAALDAVADADGLIAVSPIYTASYSGLFKSFFDVLDKDALTGKPTLIAATGGTARHSLALDHSLRPMFAYLRAFVVPTAVFAASEDWASAGGESLNERIERAGGELATLLAGAAGVAGTAGTAAASATARKKRDEFEDVVPFEQRMAALRAGL